MTQNNVFLAADYAEALITARRAKNLVAFVLFLLIVVDMALFFTARYTQVMEQMGRARELLQYAVGIVSFLGLILPVLLAALLCIILHIMLVGRLVGSGKMMSALCWSVLLALLLFPWQAFLNNPAITNDASANALGMKIPGILYTWAEFIHPKLGARFSAADDLPLAILRWARFVGFPALSLVILFIIQSLSGRSLREAIGNEISASTDRPILPEP